MATNERGQRIAVTVPVERALTLYLDRAEVVTLMTLGAHPEWLVLGYLLNQRMVESVAEVESVTVDWETGAAAVRTHRVSHHSTPRDASRVVTTGCGQGSMFSDLIDTLGPVPDTPPATSRRARYTPARCSTMTGSACSSRMLGDTTRLTASRAGAPCNSLQLTQESAAPCSTRPDASPAK
jgi:formate dehydrogenase assembly factor FdhD